MIVVTTKYTKEPNFNTERYIGRKMHVCVCVCEGEKEIKKRKKKREK